ncbi:hypothetical protein O181_012543 [Austropuccinia psidii MF-1]|uniref:Uncharacterized protein n=1 Tax=Austropuccinia psidii MF-1 TaxID=1389203 RepID=A0A9Q3BXH3_9BASI|nr:hypothetical protein [Austropuccinia psidii MF-1]
MKENSNFQDQDPLQGQDRHHHLLQHQQDHHPSIISISTPKVLLIPIQPFKLKNLERILNLIFKFSNFPLSKLSKNQPHLQSPSSSQSQPHLLLNFILISSFKSLNYQNFLQPFQLHRKPFGVIGLIDGSQFGPFQSNHHPNPNQSNLIDALRTFEIILATHFPRTPVGRCLVYNSTEFQSIDLIPSSLILIPNVIHHQEDFIKIFITEFLSDLIKSFNDLSDILQSISSLETPKQLHQPTLFDSFPILPSLTPKSAGSPTSSPKQLSSPQTNFSKLAAPQPRQPAAHMLTNPQSSPQDNHLSVHYSSPSPSTSPHHLPNFDITNSTSLSSHDSKNRKKHLGRIRKLEADLQLLAGNPSNALKIYTDAINALRLTSDLVWWAAALEGLAVTKILLLLSGSPLQFSLEDLVESLELAIETYFKSLPCTFGGPLTTNTQEAVCPLVFVEALFRLLDLKLGWFELRHSQDRLEDRLMLKTLLGKQLSQATFDRIVGLSSDQLSEINQMGSMAESAVASLPIIEDRIKALSKLAGVFEQIGFNRKAAWFKRELIAVVVEQVNRYQASIPSEGRQHLVKLIEQICQTFRLSVDEGIDGPLIIDDSIDQSNHLAPGWRDLQLGVLEDAVMMCDYLMEDLAEFKFCLKLNQLVDQSDLPGLEIDQRLKFDNRRITLLLKTFDRHSLTYWGPRNLVMAIELMRLSDRHAPIKHHRCLGASDGLKTQKPDALPTFFYYNHNRPAASKNSLRLVKDEIVTVLVTLQNPMAFEFVIPMICLSTGGVDFTAHPKKVSIQPRTIKTIELTGTPTTSGTLKIRGCLVLLIGCQKPQEFIVTIGKFKKKATSGLNNHANDNKYDVYDNNEQNILSCEVLESMPFLRIVGGCQELVQSGGVMVYDGETKTIEVELKNTSQVRADWLEVTVCDTLSDSIKKKTQNLTAQPTGRERHHMEFELVNRPVLQAEWSPTIESFGNGYVRLKCLGKIGCQSLGVVIGYGTDKVGMKRELQWNIGLSVQKALKIVGFESLASGLIVIKVKNTSKTGQVFAIEAKGGKVNSNKQIMKSQNQILQPTSTCCVMIEIEPITITTFELNTPIPNLINRQFVINEQSGLDLNKNNQAELEQEKINFWLKEKFLEIVKMKWKEIGTNRFGELNLRELDFSGVMVSNWRADEISIESEIFLDKGSKYSSSIGNDRIENEKERVKELKLDQLYQIGVKIRNDSGVRRRIKFGIEMSRLNGAILKPEEEELSYLTQGLNELFINRNGINKARMLEFELKENGSIQINELIQIKFLSKGTVLLKSYAICNGKNQVGANDSEEQKMIGIDVIRLAII